MNASPPSFIPALGTSHKSYAGCIHLKFLSYDDTKVSECLGLKGEAKEEIQGIRLMNSN